MEYTKLPEVKEDKVFDFSHFPNRFYAAVFRLWETCGAKRLAAALSVPEETIRKAAQDMGLKEPVCLDRWIERGYISIIKSAWHILPYNQLLKLLDCTEDELALVLKEEDFLDIKLGKFKPYCEEVAQEELLESGKEKLAKIKRIMTEHFSFMPDVAMPFDFFDKEDESEKKQSDGLRLVYSYCGIYASVLDKDISISYPDKLLKRYKNSGVNAVWLPVVLYQIVPFPFDEKRSSGWQMRQKRLKELVEKAAKYDIKVYLYLNEPRCMPKDFFDDHPELLGGIQNNAYGSLCTSVPAVMEYLRGAIRNLCQSVEGLGGFFTITCSEYLTHCKSRKEATVCTRCKDVPVYKLVSDVLRAISEESRNVNPEIKTIAWTWAWDNYMTKEEIAKCIDLIPKEVMIECNSEIKKEFTIGGVKGEVADYSMSIPGPGPLAEYIWDYAKNKGHEVCAKVQVNNSWECSTVPFIPVFDLIREHMKGLKKAGINNLMLSWTLGGYPSINLKIASSCLEDESEEKYDELLKSEFGEYSQNVKQAATIFSEAFREFPFHVTCLYFGPQNPGPSNLLYLKPSTFTATMTGFCYDTLDWWRADYPREIFINQMKKVAEGFEKGLQKIENMPDCEFKQVSYATYAIFKSSYLQAEFINVRDGAEGENLCEIAQKEKELAVLLYNIMQKNSRIGYEAANHYYYTKSMLAEKVLNCEYIKEKLQGEK